MTTTQTTAEINNLIHNVSFERMTMTDARAFAHAQGYLIEFTRAVIRSRRAA